MVAVGKLHRQLAFRSLCSLRECLGESLDGFVRVVSDSKDWPQDVEVALVAPFEFMGKAHEHKVCGYDHSPFDRTLMVDADTLFVRSPLEMMGRNLQSGLGMALDPRPFVNMIARPHPEVGDWMRMTGQFWPHWNTGVMLFERCVAIQNLFRSWEAAWKRMSVPPDSYPPDQPAFYVASCEQQVRPDYLGPEWNFCGLESEGCGIIHQIRPKVFLGSNQ